MSYELNEAKDLVIKAGLDLCEKGLVARTWGNISARISDTQYVITPSGKAYDSLTRNEIVVVNIQDGTFEGNVKPSGEKGVHEAVYKLRPEVNFVIHTHQQYASALSILEKCFEVLEEDHKRVLGKYIPCAGYGMYATKKLIENVKKQLKKYPDSKAVLMKYHGAVCVAKDYEEAFSVASALEKESKDIFKSLCGENGLAQEKDVQSDFVLSGVEEIKKIFGVEGLVLSQNVYTVAMSKIGKTMAPYLDDIAQIGGVNIRTVNVKNDLRKIIFALQNRNAVFIKDVGAICIGADQSEAEALASVLEKACMAAYLAEQLEDVKALSPYHARLDRKAYINSYSKLK